MEKRLFMAIGISMLVILTMSRLTAPPVPPDDSGRGTARTDVQSSQPTAAPTLVRATPTTTAPPAATPTPLPVQAAATVPSSPWNSLPQADSGLDQEVYVDTPLYEIVFTTLGGLPTAWRLKNYRETFRDPRYLELAAARPLPFDPMNSVGKALQLSPAANQQFFRAVIDHRAYNDFLAYREADRERGEPAKGGGTQALVNMVYPSLTGPFAGPAVYWGARADETIQYQADRTSVEVHDAPGKVVFSSVGNGFRVEKEFRFDPLQYAIDVTIRIVSESDRPIVWGDESHYYSFCWRGGVGRPSNAQDLMNQIYASEGKSSVTYQMQKEPGFFSGSKGIHELLFEAGPLSTLASAPDKHAMAVNLERRGQSVDWVALVAKYFTAAIVPDGMMTDRLVLGLNYTVGEDYYVVRPEIGLAMPLPETLNPNVRREESFRLYVGPKDEERLAALHETLPDVSQVTFAWLVQPIITVMIKCLRFFYSFVPDYGICIILLTILVKLIMFPLFHKQQVSMKKLQSMQPQMNALKEQHKNDPQRLQKETMEFYKRHKINPAAGCLMMLPMMPIFIALWVTFNSSLELRGAPFLGWIHDLSKPDSALFLPIGEWIVPINILPVMYAAAMYWSQSRQQQPDSPNASVMKMLPFIFVFIFWNFASGVILYFVVSILIDTLQRLVMDTFGIGAIAPAAPAPSGASAPEKETAEPETPARSQPTSARKPKKKKRR